MSEMAHEPAPPSTEPRGLDDALLDAIDHVLSIDALEQLGHFAHRLQSTDELVARLEYEAVRCIRASDGYAALHRYDLAAGERERGAKLRGLAGALCTLFALVVERKRRR